MNFLTPNPQIYVNVAIFIFGLLVGSLSLWMWFWQKRKLRKSQTYYTKTRLNLWEHFKQNIFLMAACFFYIIGFSGLFILLASL